MDAGRFLPGVCVVLVFALLGTPPGLRAEDPFLNRGNSVGDTARGSSSHPSRLPLPIALDTLPPSWQSSILKVMQQPNLTAMSQVEEFHASTDMYQWLLDHPDRTTMAWKRMKVAALDIEALEGGRFRCQDDQGSELVWRTVAKNGEGRIWYAEGKVRPSPLLPLIPVRAVAVMQHRLKKEPDGDVAIRHQVEVYLQTDSRFAALVTRMLGPAAPRMAEQGAEQLLIFFSGIARYTYRYPEKISSLLDDPKSSKP